MTRAEAEKIAKQKCEERELGLYLHRRDGKALGQAGFRPLRWTDFTNQVQDRMIKEVLARPASEE